MLERMKNIPMTSSDGIGIVCYRILVNLHRVSADVIRTLDLSHKHKATSHLSPSGFPLSCDHFHDQLAIVLFHIARLWTKGILPSPHTKQTS